MNSRGVVALVRGWVVSVERRRAVLLK